MTREMLRGFGDAAWMLRHGTGHEIQEAVETIATDPEPSERDRGFILGLAAAHPDSDHAATDTCDLAVSILEHVNPN